MRITGGQLRGRVLPGRVAPGVRPTSSRVREALFAVLGQDLTGVRVLDVFGGTGLMTFEALSRGAEGSVVVEKSRRNVNAIRASAEALGLTPRVHVVAGASPRAIPSDGRFDLVFMDPPYGLDPKPHLDAIADRVTWRAVVELPADVEAPDVRGLDVLQVRAYGGTRLAIYVRSDSGEGR